MATAKSPRLSAAQKRILVSLKILSAEFPAAEAFHPYDVWCLIIQPSPPKRATYKSLLRLGLIGSVAGERSLLYFLTKAGRGSIDDLEIKVTRDMRASLKILKDRSTRGREDGDGPVPEHVRMRTARELGRALGTTYLVERERALRRRREAEIDTASADDLRQKRLL